MNDQTIFVTGSTGNQGGAVARSLAKSGYKVKALTRNAISDKAKALAAQGIEVVQGNLNEPESFKLDLENVYGVFSVQSFEEGTAKEIKQGTTLADVAKEKGVQHFVYSSVAGAQLAQGVAHFESKQKIEDHIKSISLPFTIIRPASLFENFLLPQVRKGIPKGKLIQLVNKDTVMQYVSAEDVGTVATQVFKNKEKYLQKTIELATEELSGQEVAQVFSEVLGIPVPFKKLPAIIVRLFIGKDVYNMYNWINKRKRFGEADLASVKQQFGDLLPMKQWIRTHFGTSTP